MSYWPFWAGALGLAAVALGHWFLIGRLMAVSGRFSALVNLARWGAPPPQPKLSEAELLAAMQAATLDAFGTDAVEAGSEAETEPPAETSKPAVSASRQPWWLHVLFFTALTAGGFVAGLHTGSLGSGAWLRGATFEGIFGSGPTSLWPLLLGGVLVGFGTRMAGGCTSGHGLCGVSRIQPGSLLATCSFFGAGIGASFLLEALSR